uniref:RNase III domain-containing protein n=1 Tax=Mycena chlorophos TaxID=658473 RepID=A0ABQ0LAZ7_MYCCL|nr:predicted protein [Mycena chlorophos]
MAAPLPTFELPPLPTINDKALEKRAFTHTSYYGRPAAGFEDKADDLSPDYERLEFIGDSVIQLAVTGLLHEMYPGLRVGPASKLRSALVENASFAPISVHYGLPQRLLANPVQAMVLKNTPSVQADIFEAFIGALYLDQGFDIVRPWLSKLFTPLAEYHCAIIRAQHGHSAASEPAEASGYLVLLNQALQSQGIANNVEWKFKDVRRAPQQQGDALVGLQALRRGRTLGPGLRIDEKGREERGGEARRVDAQDRARRLRWSRCLTICLRARTRGGLGMVSTHYRCITGP